MELSDKKSLFTNPLHLYTRALLNAIPRPELRHETLKAIPGAVCNLFEPPPGCKFHLRCSKAKEICKTTAPETVRPICFAAFRFITNSNLVGCSTGKSAGLAPLPWVRLP